MAGRLKSLASSAAVSDIIRKTNQPSHVPFPFKMNLQSVLQKFNPSKFIVYNCLLAFTVLLALRLDGTIQISYWLVFSPLWFWKGLVILGALIGTIVWCRNPLSRLNDSSYVHFKSMLISLSLQLLLLMFELLSCDKASLTSVHG